MKKLWIFWIGVSKGGNTKLMLSETETIELERKAVKIGKKTYSQIIMGGVDGEVADRSDSVSYYILLEGDVTADFAKGQQIEVELTNTVIAKGAKGTIKQALLK